MVIIALLFAQERLPIMNLLLDTCVVIDYLGRKEPFFATAERVVAAGFFGDAKLWVADQSLNDAFYILKRYQSSASVQGAIRELLSLINISVLTADDYRKATQLEWDDLEDCLVSLAASHANADYLITRDATGFRQSSVPVLTPTELLKHLHTEHLLTYDSVAL